MVDGEKQWIRVELGDFYMFMDILSNIVRDSIGNEAKRKEIIEDLKIFESNVVTESLVEIEREKQKMAKILEEE